MDILHKISQHHEISCSHCWLDVETVIRSIHNKANNLVTNTAHRTVSVLHAALFTHLKLDVVSKQPRTAIFPPAAARLRTRRVCARSPRLRSCNFWRRETSPNQNIHSSFLAVVTVDSFSLLNKPVKSTAAPHIPCWSAAAAHTECVWCCHRLSPVCFSSAGRGGIAPCSTTDPQQ